MSEVLARIAFGLRLLVSADVSRDRTCPYCHGSHVRRMARKRLLMSLLECESCALMFRWPKETDRGNRKYYQRSYRQSGLTTDVPSPARLAHLVQTGFAGTEKDLSEKLGVLKGYVPRGLVVDYGCSWGYGAFQMAHRGYDVLGFEVSEERAAYGTQHLGIKTITDRAGLAVYEGRCDAVFSSHVLEHLPSPREAFEDFARLLRPDGVAVIFVPNAGGTKARNLGAAWGPLFGRHHSLTLTATFFHRALPAFGFRVACSSDPHTSDRRPRLSENGVVDGKESLDGDELLVVAQRADGTAPRP